MAKPRYIDIAGQRFGSLVAVEPIRSESGLKWLCKCDCGNDHIVAAASLRKGATRSCGCKKGNHIKDISGVRFGRLVALKRVSGGHTSKWLCRCDCGNEVVRSLRTLTGNRNHSCGCWIAEGNMYRRHGGSFSITYKSWASIKIRCCNPKDKHYPDYGGRGIRVCDRWLGEHGFENFLADMGERPSAKHSIDRIDVNGDYCPENCRWATAKEQANNKRNNILIEHNGEVRTLPEWCDSFGVEITRARKRYYRGLTFDKIFEKTRLPQRGSKGSLSDDEVRFIRSHTCNYKVFKELFKRTFGKELSCGMFYMIRSNKSYINVI